MSECCPYYGFGATVFDAIKKELLHEKEKSRMSIHEYHQSYENAHHAIMDEMIRAEAKHPHDMTFDERWRAIHKELYEAKECLSAGDYEGAMREAKHVGTTLYRFMRLLNTYTGVGIR